MQRDLDPITPKEAVELYLKDRQSELAEETLRSHRSRLSFFEEWCGEQGIENLNSLSGRDMHRYRVWRREGGNLAPASEKAQMDCIRVFIRFLEKIDAVRPDLSTSVVSPSLSEEEASRDVLVEAEAAEEILDYLSSYEFASARHVCFRLAWRAALRRGSLRALDVDDYNAEEQSLRVVHRPASGTPLKNKNRGERYVALSSETCEIIDAWIADRRPSVQDSEGREPLLATSQGGRPHPGTIQSYIYSVTKPCLRTRDCPHDRVVEECEAASDRTKASQCPSSTSPHSVRRGAVTFWLSQKQPEAWISARANMSSEILNLHYDGRGQKERMEQRRGYLDNI